MNINDKLNMALYGYEPKDPISQFTFLWNKCGVLISEDKVRIILKNVPLRELTEGQKEIFWRAINMIKERGLLEPGKSLDPDAIREILIRVSPILQDPKYAKAVNALVREIMSTAPEIWQVEEPAGPEVSPSDPESIAAYSRLGDVPETPPKFVDLPHIGYEREKRKTHVPTKWLKRAQKRSSSSRPDFTTKPRYR